MSDHENDLRYMLFQYRSVATQYAEEACQVVEAFVAEKDARIFELEATMDAVLKLIADAAHEKGCSVADHRRGHRCNCWKSKIGSK